MGRRRANYTAQDIFAKREQQRARQKEASFFSFHKIGLEDSQKMAHYYQILLGKTEDKFKQQTILIELAHLESKMKMHAHALQTGERVRPVVRQYELTRGQMEYIKRAAGREELKPEIDQEVMLEQLDQRLREGNPDWDEEMEELLKMAQEGLDKKDDE